MLPVAVAEDRAFRVEPYEIVRTGWIDIDLCVLGSRDRMSPEGVEKKWRRLLQQGDCACWPPPVGVWSSGRFCIMDGRHEYIAHLMMGRAKIFVAWTEKLR